jgi:O-antigen ligase
MMVEPNRRAGVSLAVGILALLLFGLPWTAGGRSPAGQCALLLLTALAAAAVFATEPPASLQPAFLLCLLLVGASSFRSFYPDRTVQTLLSVASYAMAGLIAARGARHFPWAGRVLLGALALGGVCVGGVGVVQWYGGNDAGIYARVLIGPFGYPNAMAAFLLLATGAALALSRLGLRRIERMAGYAAALAFLAGIVLTRSRGALLAGGVGLTTWLLLRSREDARRPWAPAALGGAVAGGCLAGGLFWTWVLPRVAGGGLGDGSLLWRAQILEWTWAMIRDHPWLGVGPGSYPVALLQYQRRPYISGENPHNALFEVAAEYGLPCLLLLLLAGGRWVRRLWRMRAPSVSPNTPAALPILVGTLAALVFHGLFDMITGFPVIPLGAAVLIGLVSAQVPPPRVRSLRLPAWAGRALAVIVLGAAALLGLTRYYATSLAVAADTAAEFGDIASARHDFDWALHLNPLSFRARQGLAWMLVQAGDPAAGLDVAEAAVAVAPQDPNTHFLAGEIAGAARRWESAEAYYGQAVTLAPFAHFRYHAGLVQATFAAGHSADVNAAYEKALESFPVTGITSSEGRCLSPGDRYLMARVSRIAAMNLPSETLRLAAAERARELSQPDRRGICSQNGLPDRQSPEAAVLAFWKDLQDGNWPQATRFLVPGAQTRQGDENGVLASRLPRALAIARISALRGNEGKVTIWYVLESHLPGPSEKSRCGISTLLFSPRGWLLDSTPRVLNRPCE